MSHGLHAEVIRWIALFGGAFGISAAIYFHVFLDRFVPGEYIYGMILFGLGLIGLGTIPSVGHVMANTLRLLSYMCLILVEGYIIFISWERCQTMPTEDEMNIAHEH